MERMKKRTKENPNQVREKKTIQHEDIIWKTMMQFFAEEVLPFLGITGKVAGIGPTELVSLEATKFYEDFTLRMEDGRWLHFEFQSRDGGIVDLKRFHAYEAVAEYQNDVEIVTYVLYSGKIKNPITEYCSGLNTYRVVPVILQEHDADVYLKELGEKVEAGEILPRERMVRLALSPLMGGESSIKERLKEVLRLVRECRTEKTEDKNKIGAVIYAMADKFLESIDMEELKEGFAMTKMGEMLVEMGREKGKQESKLEIARNLLGLLDEETIAAQVGLSLETVRSLKEE